MRFNPALPTVMHVDINSCFATIEQQSNPFLRGKPVVVGAYTAGYGCVLAASIEAKRLGIKTGMRVWEAKKIYPQVVVLPPDPPKYRHVHLKLKAILSSYSYNIVPKSIDEFVFDISGFPCMAKGALWVGLEIKQRIRREIGEWIRVSIGIGPNRILAKTAAGLTKPDGLEVIYAGNAHRVYERLAVTDLCGIASRNAVRLRKAGIYTTTQLAQASVPKLRYAFSSIVGYYWYLRLRGWEIDEVEFGRKSFGNSFVIPPEKRGFENVYGIISRLVDKTAFRLRRCGFAACGVGVSLVFEDRQHWHMSNTYSTAMFETQDIYTAVSKLIERCPIRTEVLMVAEWVFSLSPLGRIQMELFRDVTRVDSFSKSVDRVNSRWGENTLGLARGFFTGDLIKDRIAFGGVKELENVSVLE